ncbi:MAG: hypothetical protein GY866_01170 [Proteobacteria bacterium]|nr:hypothetical protein [Pseudomonadota bacterium]
MEIWMLVLGWVLFGGTHIGLSALPLRTPMIEKMGDKGFQGIYSLISLATFGFLIYAYVVARPAVAAATEAGGQGTAAILNQVLMLVAFILLFCGFMNKNPMGMVPTGAELAKPESAGMVRITRHPMNMAFALFGLAHVLTGTSSADWIFFGGFVVFSLLSSWHQDKKKVRLLGKEVGDFVANTSIIPFAAIVTGKQKFAFSEIRKAGILIAVVVAVVARALHPAIYSQF